MRLVMMAGGLAGIRSAVADNQKAGCVVEYVKIERDSPLPSSE
jgi:hypothetical protein